MFNHNAFQRFRSVEGEVDQIVLADDSSDITPRQVFARLLLNTVDGQILLKILPSCKRGNFESLSQLRRFKTRYRGLMVKASFLEEIEGFLTTTGFSRVEIVKFQNFSQTPTRTFGKFLIC